MILREVAVHRYSVYAVCGFPTEEQCEVEIFLNQYRHSYPKAMRDLDVSIRVWTPQHGPPFEVEERAKRLRGGICEFRARERRKDKLPRVLFFEDGMRIVCTNAFLKKGSTPDEQIDRAIAIRTQYVQVRWKTHRILRGWGVYHD
jgi:hypothetical protein